MPNRQATPLPVRAAIAQTAKILQFPASSLAVRNDTWQLYIVYNFVEGYYFRAYINLEDFGTHEEVLVIPEQGSPRFLLKAELEIVKPVIGLHLV